MNKSDVFVLCEEILRCLEYLHHLMNQYFMIGQFIVLETQEKCLFQEQEYFNFSVKLSLHILVYLYLLLLTFKKSLD